MNPISAIQRKVARLRWRLRAQTALRWGLLTTAVACGLGVVALALYKAWLLPPTAWTTIGWGVAATIALGVVAGLVRRYDPVLLAQRIDDVHDLKDRLGTALLIAKKPEAQRTDFEQAQLRDAARHVDAAQPGLASPWRFPHEIGWVALALLVAWGVTFARMAPPEMDAAGLRPVFFGDGGGVPLLPPPQAVLPEPEEPLDPEVQEEIAEAVQDNTQALKPLVEQDAEGHEFLTELNKTLEELAQGEIDDKALLQKTRELEQDLERMAGDEQAMKEYEETQEALEKVAEELLKKAPKALRDKDAKEDVKALAEALKKENYEMAAQKLEELLKRFEKMSPKEQERMAKLLEKLGQKFQPQLSKEMERLRKKRDRLQRKAEAKKGGPSKRERNRLNRMKKQLERLGRKQEQQEAKQGGKQLKNLSRNLRDLANRMRRQPPPKKGQKGQAQKKKGEQQRRRLSKEDGKRMRDMMKRMKRMQRRQRLKRQGKMRLADLKELMRKKRGGGKEGRKRLRKLARGKRGKKGRQGDTQMQPGKSGQKKEGVEWMKSQRRSDADTAIGKAREGDGVGASRGRMLQGKPTDIKAKLEDDFVKGKQGKGPSIKEVLYGAASEGTRVPGYGEVHIDYSMRAARQMDKEKLPPGYREYVEEYFRLTRPQ